MAGDEIGKDEKPTTSSTTTEALLSRYLGLSFAAFLSLLPKNTLDYVSSLQSRNRVLATRLFEAEEQLKQMRARRRDDARANARAAEILAGHRTAWLDAERNLLNRLDEAHSVESELRARVERLERELAVANAERDELEREDEGGEEVGGDDDRNDSDGEEEGEGEGEELNEMYQHGGLQSSYLDLASYQGMEYDSIESMYGMKHVIPRRETPWKIDMESSGVPSKLKEVEEDLTNLENVGGKEGDLCKILSLMRKQAKRYQSLSSKIEDICKRMQASDPYDATIGPEFRTQRQTEFLMEAFRLQQRATDTRHKIGSIQSETLKAHFGDELTAEDKLNVKRSLDSVRSNFKEIQRNSEVWLARILGDLEGMLARDGASRMREYYL
ncbi:hypothetical protein LUZ60_013466 [Juncus effusus]|nr:hypothetical protein LUZ60_013466 [Juncus effusus]